MEGEDSEAAEIYLQQIGADTKEVSVSLVTVWYVEKLSPACYSKLNAFNNKGDI